MSPKERFQQTADLAGHIRTVENLAFEHACEIAMLQMIDELPTAGDDEGRAAANSRRVEGAKMFVQVLNRLADKPKEQTFNPMGQLNQKA